MSDTLLDATDLAKTRVQEPTFEQRLFAWSPLGTGATALAIFLVLAALYAASATLAGWPLIDLDKSGPLLPPDTRAALVISLLIATALGMQRYARLKDMEEGKRASATLAKCFNRNYFGEISRKEFSRRLGAATAVGVIVGIALTLYSNHRTEMQTWMVSPPHIWFALMSVMLSVLFARGAVMTRLGAAATRQFIERDLVIDLLRIDELAPLGKSSARVSLIWFSVSAVSCLSLSSAVGLADSIALIVGCAAIGIAIFVLTMEKVHRKIKSAKAAELARVRSQMDTLRHALHADAEAAVKLQGLIAYEQRIERAPEWPFDQTTAMRLGASALILTVPWFGQALAQTVVDRVGHFVH